MAKVPEMSPEFARWYAEAFMDEGETRALRWNGVVNVAAKSDHKTVEVLTRLAFQSIVPAAGRKNEDLAEAYQFTIATIAGPDAVIDPVQSAREVQILAAATLVRLFATSPDAALVVATTSFIGSRKPDLPMDLANLADSALAALSAKKHMRPARDKLKQVPPKIEFTLTAETLQSMEPAVWKAQFDRMRDATIATFEQVVKTQNQALDTLRHQMSLSEEELQMLWWLTGGYSRVLDKPFDEVETILKPFVLAYEMAEMTVVSPGPSSVKAILLKAGIANEMVKLEDVVNGSEREWAKSASESQLVSPLTTPLHFALEQRAELGSDDTWQHSWSSLTGLTPDISLPSDKVAELFYREHIFLNVVG